MTCKLTQEEAEGVLSHIVSLALSEARRDHFLTGTRRLCNRIQIATDIYIKTREAGWIAPQK